MAKQQQQQKQQSNNQSTPKKNSTADLGDYIDYEEIDWFFS